MILANEETVRCVKMVNGKVHAYHVDLTKRTDVYRVADLVKKEVGKVRNDLLKFKRYLNRIEYSFSKKS